jgi:hypothetical protein
MEEGWVCPKCGKVNAPWKGSCDCVVPVLMGYPTYPVYPQYPYWTPYPWPNWWGGATSGIGSAVGGTTKGEIK